MSTHLVTKPFTANGKEYAIGDPIDYATLRLGKSLEERRFIRPLTSKELSAREDAKGKTKEDKGKSNGA